MKKCYGCKTVKERNAFAKHKGKLDGLQTRCRECAKKYSELYRVKNKEKVKANSDLWYQNNKERKKESTCRWRKANPEKVKAISAKQVKNSPEKVSARNELHKAMLRGVITKPLCCSECWATGIIHGHHPDYDKPLEVVWLCPQCHSDLHSYVETEEVE